MESASTEGVGRSSNPRTRPRQQIRKSRAESPNPAPRRPQKKRKRKKETPSIEYYSVKEILDEKRVEGQIRYLIDWEDNTETGESYTPTWEPSKNVNRQAILDWEKRNRERQGRLEENNQQVSSISDPYLSSPPIRTAKRQRIRRPSNPPSPIQRQAQKPRRAGTAETARFQSVSQDAVESQRRPSEIKDSYEDEEEQLSSGSGRIRVEIPVNEGFDRDAYIKVTVVSSQPSQPSQTTQPSQPSVYSTSRSHLQTATPRSKLFIWDEPDEDIPIIPDSQELPGSSSYQPTQTATSNSGLTTRLNNTGTDADADLASTESPQTQWRPSSVPLGSSSKSHRHSEPPSLPSRPSRFKGSELNVSEPDRGAENSSAGERHLGISVEEPQNNPQQHSSDSERAEAFTSSVSLNTRPEPFYFDFAAERSVSRESHLSLPITQVPETLQEEVAHSLSQTQVHRPLQPEVDDGSDLDFPIELPSLRREEYLGGQNPDEHVIQSANRFRQEDNIHNQSTVEEAESWTFSAGSQQEESLQPTERSVSSSEANWQAAQVISQYPRTPSRQEIPTLLDTQIDSPAVLPQSEVSQAPSTTANLSDPELSAQRSNGQLQEQVPSQEKSELLPIQKGSGRLLDHPLDTVFQSIEGVGETLSSPATSIPSPPPSSLSRYPETYGRNRSAKPAPPPTVRMADQTMEEQMSVTEMLKQARATAAANMMARQAAARAASAIPHTSPPVVSQMLPLRETAREAPVPLAESAPSPKTFLEEEPMAKSLVILGLGENEYAVPLPMVSLARDIYDQEITNHKQQLVSFLNEEEIDTTLVEEINLMIERLKLICDHQDLIDEDSSTQQMEPDHRQARWAENISTKCIFLAEFFDALRVFEVHVVVSARPGRMMDILEALFRTHEYIYNRPDRPEPFSQTAHGPMRITLLAADMDQSKFLVEPAALVIAFDSTFEREPYSKDFRANPMNMTKLAPLIHLVVSHSIEHLEMCIEKNMEPRNRRAVLVNSLSQMRHEVGKLNVEYLLPDAAAKAVAAFTVGNTEGAWPLQPMPDIECIESIQETSAEPEARELLQSESTMQSYDISSSTPLQPGFKRALGTEDDIESSKRQRLTPISWEQSGEIETSVDNETILRTTQSRSSSNAAVETDKTIAQTNSLDEEQEQVCLLLKKISELEGQLRSKEATETERRQFNQRLEARCQDYEKSIQQIQPKYQEALNDRGHFQHEITESLVREASLQQRLDARVAELTKIREEKALLDAEVAAARTALSTSSIPEVAELQKLKDELSTVRAENERLQKKIGSMQNDAEYMRGNYQKASSAAAAMRNELDEAKTEISVLRSKASENSVRIHEIQASSEITQHLQRIVELEGEKAEVERELEKKTEELRTLMNGRRQTRGTSAPMSPRMGTNSPGTASRPMARVMSAVGSRGNSPAPGADGPFPTRGAFGDALFAPVGSANRWGNHLT